MNALRGKTTVGVVGAGRMGLPIIGHLVRAGFAVVVNDAQSDRQSDVEAKGARWVSDVGELGASAQLVLLCVGFDREVRELLEAPAALIAGASRETVVAILSTVHPATVQALAKSALSRGVHVIDSTICRGGKAADEGTLLSFVGGSPELVERITPVLRAYSSDIVHSGGVGTAQVAKAVNNLIMWSCLVANHEGLALARRYDVDVEALRHALLTSSASNAALANWGTQTMAWAQDDMAIVDEMADDCAIALPLSGVVREICRTLKPRRYQLDAYGK